MSDDVLATPAFLILQNLGAFCHHFSTWWTWTFSLITGRQACCLDSQRSHSLPCLLPQESLTESWSVLQSLFFSFEFTQVKQSPLLLSYLSLIFRAKSASHSHPQWKRNNFPKTWGKLVCSQLLGNSPRQISPVSSNLLISDFLSKGTTWGWARGFLSARSLTGSREAGKKCGWRKGGDGGTRESATQYQ